MFRSSVSRIALRSPTLNPRITTTTAQNNIGFIASRAAFSTNSIKMGVHNVANKAEFDQVLKDHPKVIVDAFATWCGPCKAIAPVLAHMSELDQFKDVHFIKIDVDQSPDLSQELGIRAMPTFITFKDGEKSDTLMGADQAKLTALVEALAA